MYNNDLATKTTPLVGDVVEGAISYEKVGAMTVLDIHTSHMSITAESWTNWVTLTADFLKPDKMMQIPCSFGQYGHGLLEIQTTGVMRIYNPNNVSAAELYAQAIIVH